MKNNIFIVFLIMYSYSLCAQEIKYPLTQWLEFKNNEESGMYIKRIYLDKINFIDSYYDRNGNNTPLFQKKFILKEGKLYSNVADSTIELFSKNRFNNGDTIVEVSFLDESIEPISKNLKYTYFVPLKKVVYENEIVYIFHERRRRGDHSFPAKERNIIFHSQKGIIGYMYSNFGTFDIDKALFINNIKNPFGEK